MKKSAAGKVELEEDLKKLKQEPEEAHSKDEWVGESHFRNGRSMCSMDGWCRTRSH